MADPGKDQVVIASSVLFDGRMVAGVGVGTTVLESLAPPRRDERLVRLLARMALAHRPPSGFRRDVVLAHGGDHRGTFDVKRGGVLPIVDLARWAGVAAGSTATGTLARLHAGADAGILSDEHARVLAEAWDLLTACASSIRSSAIARACRRTTTSTRRRSTRSPAATCARPSVPSSRCSAAWTVSWRPSRRSGRDADGARAPDDPGRARVRGRRPAPGVDRLARGAHGRSSTSRRPAWTPAGTRSSPSP